MMIGTAQSDLSRFCQGMFRHIMSLGLALFQLGFPAFSADTLTTQTGEVLSGRILEYDEWSYMVLLSDGGKVVVPHSRVKSVEKAARSKSPYDKRSALIVSTRLIRQDQEPQRILLGELKERQAKDKEHGISLEAQALLYLLHSSEQYADAYCVTHLHGVRRKELQYEWEKDLLIRKTFETGLGVKTRILGPSGEGMNTLEQAARGRITESEGILSRMRRPESLQPPRSQQVDPVAKPTPRFSTW